MKTHINAVMNIQEDELFTSWIEVLAANNDFTVYDFLDDFQNSYYKDSLFMRKDYLRNLDYFYNEYNECGFPSVYDVMKKHSSFFACFPFRKKRVNVRISECMLRDYSRDDSKKRILSDWGIRDGIKKYMICSECVKEDIEKCFRPYVHVWHNLPGVTCCQKHGCKLVEVNSEQCEFVAAEEKEMVIARFMYQMYVNPCYGYLEQVSSIFKERFQQILISRKCDIDKIVGTVSSYLTRDELSEVLKKMNNIDDITQIIIERVCPVCGNRYHISLDAEEIGFDCPECDKNKEIIEIYQRFIEFNGNQEFEFVDVLKNKRVLVMHKKCGRYTTRSILHIIMNDISCFRCKHDHLGDTCIANNGQKMTIICYRSNDDIDVQFEDGTIVCNKRYSSFLRGEIRNPNFVYNGLKDRTGETSIATNGQQMTIIRYGGANDIDVRFEDGTEIFRKSYNLFLKGTIQNPNCKTNRVKDRTGETSIASNGQEMTIIRYGSADDIDVQFEDGMIVEKKNYYAFLKGFISNPRINRAMIRTGESSISMDGQKITIVRYGSSTDIDVQFDDGTIKRNKTYYNFVKGRINKNKIKINRVKDRTGETSIASNGQQMSIIRYGSAIDIDVQFEDGTIEKNKTYYKFLKGQIYNRKFKVNRKKDRTWESSIATNGQQMTIIRYGGCEDIDVQFEDGTIVNSRAYSCFLRGEIENPNCKYILNSERLGETSVATNGQQMTIIRYGGARDIDVLFEDGTIVYHKSYDLFTKGIIENPNCKYIKHRERLGDSSVSTKGQKMTISSYRSSCDIDVLFEDGTLVCHKTYEAFLNGLIKNPNYKHIKNRERVGEMSIATNGQKMTIVRYGGSVDIDVQFEDGTIVCRKRYSHFLKGTIRNPNFSSNKQY